MVIINVFSEYKINFESWMIVDLVVNVSVMDLDESEIAY